MSMTERAKRVLAVLGAAGMVAAMVSGGGAAAEASPVTVSQVVTTPDGKGYLEVDGKPFLMGHVQNCGAQQLLTDDPETPFDVPLPTSWLENAFEKTADMGFQTISIILKWKEIEPETQGDYDWSLIDQYVDWAEQYGLRMDFAWFGSNSGGGTRLPGHPGGFAYNVPEYLWGDDYWSFEGTWPNLGEPYVVGVPGPDNQLHNTEAQFVDDAEYDAVHALFEHLASYDTTHRTILFQVFNEPNFHSSWDTYTAEHLQRVDNLAAAVKDSDYVVATRVNLAPKNAEDEQAITDLPNVDFVGQDPYTSHVSDIADLVTTGTSPIQYVPENGMGEENSSSMMVTALVNGGFYDLWPLNDHWGDSWGTNDINIDTFVNQQVGILPPLRRPAIDIRNLNKATNKIGGVVAVSSKANMAGFNVESDSPLTNYSSGLRNVGPYGVGFSTTDGSVGMAAYEGDSVYLVSDTANPTPVNLASGKTATMSTSNLTNHDAAQAIDSDTWTFAQSDNDSPWSLTVDLGASTTMSRVVVSPDLTNYLTQYAVETSTDNTNWTQRGTITGSAALTRTFDFTPVAARYVRIHGLAESGGGSTWGHAIHDVKIFNLSNVTSSTVEFLTDNEPSAVSYGHFDGSGSWVSEGSRAYTSNGDGTYTIAYNSQEAIRVQFPAITYYNIQNRQTGEYLNLESDSGKVDANAGNTGWWSQQWQVIPVDGTHFKLKNRQTGEYINNEGNLSYAEYGLLSQPGQWSAQWEKVDVDGTYFNLKSRYQSSKYLHTESDLGYAEVTTGDPGWWTAQWRLVSP